MYPVIKELSEIPIGEPVWSTTGTGIQLAGFRVELQFKRDPVAAILVLEADTILTDATRVEYQPPYVLAAGEPLAPVSMALTLGNQYKCVFDAPLYAEHCIICHPANVDDFPIGAIQMDPGGVAMIARLFQGTGEKVQSVIVPLVGNPCTDPHLIIHHGDKVARSSYWGYYVLGPDGEMADLFSSENLAPAA